MKKSFKELLSVSPIDVVKMDRKQLSKVVSKLSGVANKRVNRLLEKNYNTPAMQSFNNSGGQKFSAKGKDVNSLRREYKRLNYFLSAKTSTIKGAKKVVAEMKQRLGNEDLSNDEINKIWETYNKAQELNPNFVKEYGSNQIQKYIREQIQDGKSVDETIKSVIDEITDKYEKTQEDENDDGIFFETGENIF